MNTIMASEEESSWHTEKQGRVWRFVESQDQDSHDIEVAEWTGRPGRGRTITVTCDYLFGFARIGLLCGYRKCLITGRAGHKQGDEAFHPGSEKWCLFSSAVFFSDICVILIFFLIGWNFLCLETLICASHTKCKYSKSCILKWHFLIDVVFGYSCRLWIELLKMVHVFFFFTFWMIHQDIAKVLNDFRILQKKDIAKAQAKIKL